MIKLINLLREVEEIEPPFADDEFIEKSFRTTPGEIDPETGTIVSKVEYMPKFDQIKRELYKYRNQFLPFKQHPDPAIAKNAKEINTLLTKAALSVLALEGSINLYKQELKNK